MDIDLIKQAEIISDINDLFTISLASPYHEDIGGGQVKFYTNGNHNIVVGDRVTFYNSIDNDNVITDFNEYNPNPGKTQYTVLSVTDDTFTVEATYDASYDMTNAKIKTVKVYSNDILTPDDISEQDFPIVIVGVDNTYTKKSASNVYLPQTTDFPFLIMDAVEKHSGGVNTKLNSCREFVSNKFVKIMEELNLDIRDDIVYRYEGEFGTEVSVKRCVLIK